MGPLFILFCTVIWGTAFLAQKTGAEHYGPFTLTCYRNILAGFFLLGVVALRDRLVRGRGVAARTLSLTRAEFVGGAVCGAVLFAAMAAQQLGIEHTTPGISAFLTANYILLVPVFACFAGRERPRRSVWPAVVLALGGTYLLSFASGAAEGTATEPAGVAWTLLCAVLFAFQIMVVDRYAPQCDVLKFSMVQMFAAGLCAAPFILLPGEAARLTFAHFRAGWLSLFYVGVLSSGVAYTFQNLGQARTPPALAAIIMSFEGVVGVVAGWLVRGDALSPRQLTGCGLVFAAILLVQIPHAQGRST